MAIDPTTTTTVKVSELASAGYNTTDLIPHEVAGILKKGNLQDLATFIGGIISTEGAVGFRAVTVTDGQTLPATTEEEFILVGPGTYPNVGGGSPVTTTEPLNALVSNGTYWFIGVEIPIGATGVWGTISGTLDDQTDLQDALDLKADLVDGKVPSSQLPSYVDDVVEVANYAALPATGETGKIYITIDTNKVYRWSGSAYIEIADNNAVWGMITGTLSDQTDLNTALGLKVPYTGATGNVDLGSHKLTASDLVVNHTSGSGTAATISKGGNGEALTVTKSSGSGNVASFSGGVTSISELHLTTDLADAYIASAATWNAKQSALTFSSPLVNTSGTISIPVASGSANGYLSSTDWNTFNAKQSALNGTGFVKASGTTISYDNTTYVPTSRRLTINGTDYDLTADRSWTILSGAWGYISGTLSDQEDLQAALDLKATDASVVKITTDQNVRGIKTFLGNQTATTLKLIVADYYNDGIITSDNGMLRLLNGTTELFKLASTGDLTAKSFVKSGGTSSQYLMADGSVSTGGGGTVTGTGTTNYIPKFTGTSAIGNSSIFDNGTNVGIGTTSPLSMLHAKASGYPTLTLEGSTNSGAGIRFFGDVQYAEIFGEYQSSGNGQMFFRTRNAGTISTAMTILGSGNVGIATTSPSTTLDVNGTGRINGGVNLATSSGNVGIGAGPASQKLDVNGNIRINNGNPTANTLIGILGFGPSGYGGINTSEISANFEGANWYNGSNLIFKTSQSGDITASSSVERMRITSGGDVAIGTATPLLTNSNRGSVTINGSLSSILTLGIAGSYSGYLYSDSTKLELSSATQPLTIVTNGSERMRITSGGNVGIGTTSPDAPLSFANALGEKIKFNAGAGNSYKINLLSPVNGGDAMMRVSVGDSFSGEFGVFNGGSYKLFVNNIGNVGIGTTSPATKLDVVGAITASGGFFNSDMRLKDLIDYDYNVSDIKPITYLWKDGRDNKKHVGYSAQEVQKVMPDAVNEGTDGMLSVNYVEVLVAKIAELENRIKQLEK